MCETRRHDEEFIRNLVEYVKQSIILITIKMLTDILLGYEIWETTPKKLKLSTQKVIKFYVAAAP